MHILREHTNWCFPSISLFQAFALFSPGKQSCCLALQVMNFYFTRQFVCNKTSENRDMAYSSWSAELRLPLSVFRHRVIYPVSYLAVSQQEVVWSLLLHSRARQAGSRICFVSLSCHHDSSSVETCAAQRNAPAAISKIEWACLNLYPLKRGGEWSTPAQLATRRGNSNEKKCKIIWLLWKVQLKLSETSSVPVRIKQPDGSTSKINLLKPRGLVVKICNKLGGDLTLGDTTTHHLVAAAQHWQSPASRDLHLYQHILSAVLSGAVATTRQKKVLIYKVM